MSLPSDALRQQYTEHEQHLIHWDCGATEGTPLASIRSRTGSCFAYSNARGCFYDPESCCYYDPFSASGSAERSAGGHSDDENEIDFDGFGLDRDTSNGGGAEGSHAGAKSRTNADVQVSKALGAGDMEHRTLLTPMSSFTRLLFPVHTPKKQFAAESAAA